MAHLQPAMPGSQTAGVEDELALLVSTSVTSATSEAAHTACPSLEDLSVLLVAICEDHELAAFHTACSPQFGVKDTPVLLAATPESSDDLELVAR